MESNLGHDLGEARVGTNGVGHGVDAEVHQAIDFFLVREIEKAEGFVGFSKRDVDSRGVQTGNEPSVA